MLRGNNKMFRLDHDFGFNSSYFHGVYDNLIHIILLKTIFLSGFFFYCACSKINSILTKKPDKTYCF